jgi:YD repeat-containing protein
VIICGHRQWLGRWLGLLLFVACLVPLYSTTAGRLLSKTSARGLSATYGYDNAGRSTTTDYSDTTPDVTTAFNRLGQYERV